MKERVHHVMLNQVAPDLDILTKECNVHSIEEYIALIRFVHQDSQNEAMYKALGTMTGIEPEKLYERAQEYAAKWPNLPIPTVQMKVSNVVQTPEGERTDVEFEFGND